MTQAQKIVKAMLDEQCPSCCWRDDRFAFPELRRAKAIKQRVGTVFIHTMNVLDRLQVCNPITLFAALFHDLGKVETKQATTPGGISFPGHEDVSSIIALNTMQEWEAKPYIIDRTIRIIKTHMVDIMAPFSTQGVRNFIARVGQDNIDNWFTLRSADAISYFGKDEYVTNTIASFEKRVYKIISQLPQEEGPEIKQSGDGMRIIGDDNER